MAAEVKLIHEIEKRPPLYDKRTKEHGNKIIKSLLWRQVFENTVENWSELSESEKRQMGIEIQKKWKNMRDYFAKEIAAQNGKSDEGKSRKKKKYIHFDSLLFLLPTLQQRDNSANKLNLLDGKESTDKKLEGLTTGAPEDKSESVKIKHKPDNYEEHQTPKHKVCEYDEDKSFAEMLIPMLRKLNDEQKHYAKIGILNVLQTAKSYAFTSPSQ